MASSFLLTLILVLHKLLQDRCSDFVRLSIHPSTGAVKMSVPLIMQDNGRFPRTPWHCTIAVGIDGSYRTVHAKEVREIHRLIYIDGLPYYHREKSDLWDWEKDIAVFEPQYPRGLLVRPNSTIQSKEWTLEPYHIYKLQKLVDVYCGPIVVTGFHNSLQLCSGGGFEKVQVS